MSGCFLQIWDNSWVSGNVFSLKSMWESFLRFQGGFSPPYSPFPLGFPSVFPRFWFLSSRFQPGLGCAGFSWHPAAPASLVSFSQPLWDGEKPPDTQPWEELGVFWVGPWICWDDGNWWGWSCHSREPMELPAASCC